jgi:hypothetical protein
MAASRGMKDRLAAPVIAAAIVGAALLLAPSLGSPPVAVDQIALTTSGGAPEASAASSALLTTVASVSLLEGTRLRITGLGIDLPLLMGDAQRDVILEATPSDAAFLLPLSAVPGGGIGNSYVYAHARTGMFLSLWDVQLDELVEVSEPSGVVLRYRVTEIHPRIAPTDMRWIGPSADERITLQTSTGPNGSDPRFVVVALREP